MPTRISRGREAKRHVRESANLVASRFRTFSLHAPTCSVVSACVNVAELGGDDTKRNV